MFLSMFRYHYFIEPKPCKYFIIHVVSLEMTIHGLNDYSFCIMETGRVVTKSNLIHSRQMKFVSI